MTKLEEAAEKYRKAIAESQRLTAEFRSAQIIAEEADKAMRTAYSAEYKAREEFLATVEPRVELPAQMATRE